MTTTILSSTSFNLLFQSLQNLVFAQIEFFNQSMTKLWKVNMQSTQADFTDLSLSYSFYSHQPYRVLCDKDNVGHISCLKSEKKIPMQRNIFQKGYWTLIRSFSPNPWTLLGNSQMLEIEKTGKKELGGKQNPWRLNGLKCGGGWIWKISLLCLLYLQPAQQNLDDAETFGKHQCCHAKNG